MLALVFPFVPFGVVSLISLPYLLLSGRRVGPDMLQGMAFCAGFLLWFLFPVLLLRRFSALGYWWTVGALAFPFLGSLGLSIRSGLAAGVQGLYGGLLLAFPFGVPLGLILRARRAYFTRLRMLQEGPQSVIRCGFDRRSAGMPVPAIREKPEI